MTSLDGRRRAVLRILARGGAVSVTSLALELGYGDGAFRLPAYLRSEIEETLQSLVDQGELGAEQWLRAQPRSNPPVHVDPAKPRREWPRVDREVIQRAALELVREQGGTTVRAIGAATGASPKATVRVLRELIREQRLAVLPIGSHVPYVAGPNFTEEKTDGR